MKPERSSSVNEIVALGVIRQGVLLESYKTEEVRRIVSFLNRFVEPDLEEKLRRYAGKTLSTARVEALRQAVRQIVQDGFGQMKSNLLGDLHDQAKVEAGAGTKLIANALPLDVSLVTPSVAVLRTMLRIQPINGHFVPEWFQALAATTTQAVNQQIMIGVTTGEGIDQIVRRIVGTQKNHYRDGVLQRSRTDVEAVVRTAVAGVSNNVRDEVYQANAELIKGVQITATLDTRTCVVCMAEDGQVYDVDSGPRPPFHYRCRCSTVPVLRSWKELGLPLQEANPSTRASNALTRAMAQELRDLSPEDRRAIKAKLQGQVPESLTYPQWLRRQSVAAQNEALGRTRAQLFRSGALEIPEFVGPGQRALTRAELEEVLGK
jgi:SPP1 gp7 family putative phage head morphogenesis protein